jgi:poly(A) polymerase
VQATIYKEHVIDSSLIDRDALTVIHRLRQAGFRAYLVGGSVRDLLLKQSPKDFDISTSARPEEIKRTFGRQCILIGRRFRLAHVRFGRKIIEVATFRAGEMTEGLITQDNVWGTEEEDVLRRDFTINGLFYDPEHHTVIDYVGGWQDLHHHVLHTIGDPEIRFKQDPVRMLRLLKFQARFGFRASPEVLQALQKCLPEITKSSQARILEEIFRMLESCAAAPFFHFLLESGMLKLLFPKLYSVFHSPLGDKISQYLKAVDKDNKQAARYPIERPVLIAALLLPVLEQEIKSQFLDENKTPHLGDIMGLSHALIRSLIHTAFSHFPRRISAILAYTLAAQYRLTPFHPKRQLPIRLFRTPEFPLALRLFKIRATVHPDLQNAYISWRENYRKFLRSEDEARPRKRK